MLRYCTNCKKDFDFAPTKVSGSSDLICPSCGKIIDKNSRHPVDRSDSEDIENSIGLAASKLFEMSYIFYLVLAIIGVIGFVLKIDSILYIATGIALFAFLLQLISGTLIFTSGLVFLPLGAIAGFFLFDSIQGACLGINIVFIIRHVIRDILYELLFKLIDLINK